MPKIEEFFTSDEEQQVINAIKTAETNTSGEIRVHIEKATEKDALERATEVFYDLKMNETELQNGVLFYVATESHHFAVLGDKGINELVADNFWDSEKELALSHFKKREFAKGLELAILEAGKKLQEFFPYQSDDTNELSDEISKG
ncbi:MAG: TPM domain-containing protein [Urechidicola sp.]|nr:TPM domain-containing protein [Urechidicola sp.]